MKWVHRDRSSFLLIILLLSFAAAQIADAKIHITDDLDDVVDDEEDESWKEWGKKKAAGSEFDPPPDFSKMELMDIQEEMMKRQVGPVFGFVKLRLGIKRTADMISELAMKWTKVSRTGAIEAQFMGVDSATIMFTMQRGLDSTQLREFVLSQPEAYEIKIGDSVYRRPGDPPLEVVIDRMRADKETDVDQEKDEL
uniref:Mesoderm development candidate 2 n=1 Tax=Kalanchoe fedtschenkoi TaxID=63787 RepID=A0A7N0R8C1_KALFE